MITPSPTTHQGADRAAGTNRQRILAATAEVLSRRAATKLNLSEVAAQAGLSRMTLYRLFPTKNDLISAFTCYESDHLEADIARATLGLRGVEKLDATLQFIARYQLSYSGVRMLDLEPSDVMAKMSSLVPVLSERLERLIPGPGAKVAAATVMRVAVSHYIVRSDDSDEFLAHLRVAAGIPPSEKSTPRRLRAQENATSRKSRPRT